MDFFEAQARAHRRTRRLVALFALAVVGTVAAGYFAAILISSKVAGPGRPRRSPYGYYYNAPPPPPPLALWQPDVLAGVAFATFAVVAGASLYKWDEFRRGGGAVAESVGARRLDPHSTDPAERRLLNVVEEMALAAGLPAPAVYVMDGEEAINAFAAGLTTGDAIVAVSRGALDHLTRDELQGVIGHEFSHILNGDMRLNVRLAAVIFGILVIGLAGRAVFWGFFRGRVRSSRNSGGAVMLILAAGLALLVIGYVGYFFGRAIQAAVSRQREFLADASSVQFTRNPAGISGALRKIGGLEAGSALGTHKAAGIGHFFFAQAFTSSAGSVWATHPPLADRIRAVDPGWDGTFTVPSGPDAATLEGGPSGAPKPGAGRLPPGAGRGNPKAALDSIGTLTAAAIASAQGVRDTMPHRLLAAARTPAEAPVLIFGLLLSSDAAVAAGQRNLAGKDAGPLLDELGPALAAVGPAQKLPLVQLSVPALRQLGPDALARFFSTLDDLVQADGRVDPFEYALQKMLRRSLTLAGRPTAGAGPAPALGDVSRDIAVVLSALARAAAPDEAGARGAFEAGAARLEPDAGKPELLGPDVSGLARLDAALERLARAGPAVKRSAIDAASHVVAADGTIALAEAELLRAVSAALDVPMPPIAAAQAAHGIS